MAPIGLRGTAIESCSLITTDANELQAEIHDRMPVILDEPDYDTWLDPEQPDPRGAGAATGAVPPERMTARQ